MKRNPDLSATIAKSAQEVRDLLKQTAAVVDGEWKRIAGELDEADTVSDQMKVGFNRIEDVMRAVRNETTEQVEDVAAGMSSTVEDLFDVVSKAGRVAAEQFGFDVGSRWPCEPNGEQADAQSDGPTAGREADSVVADAEPAPKVSTEGVSAKKATAKTTAKKTTAKKTTAKKTTAKKTTAKKVTAKKAAAKKAPAKKAPAKKKATAKKATAKKTTAKKAPAKKKATAKRAAAKKASS